MENSAGTLLVATRLARERAVLVHWAVCAGYRTIPLASESGTSLPPTATHPAVLVFDEAWAYDAESAARVAWARGIAPILVIGPEPGWSADEIAAIQCADFLRRPYEVDDAFARIRRVLESPLSHRKLSVLCKSGEVLKVEDLSIHGLSREVSFRGRAVTLRRAEWNVLMRLAKASPRPVSQSEIVEDVLGAHGHGATARNQVYELTKKLAAIGAGSMIETLRGSGAYRIIREGESDRNELRRSLSRRSR